MDTLKVSINDQEDRARKAMEDFVGSLQAEMGTCCPELDVLNDPQIICQEAIRKLVVDNPKHADITPLCLRVLNAHDALRDHSLYSDLSKKLFDIAGRGKLAIGVRYLLTKLERIKGAASKHEEKTIAQEALKKVASKGIVASKAVTKAVTHFATLAVS